MTPGDDEEVDEHGFVSPLHRAVNRGYLREVQSLLAGGADVNEYVEGGDFSGVTALHLAALRGHVRVMETLLQAGARVNAPTRNGLTPLHFAAGNGHRAAVQTLLHHKADVNAMDDRSNTPLHLAANAGVSRSILPRTAEGGENESTYSGIVRDLLKAGADPDVRDGIGISPLDVAAKDNRPGVVKALLAGVAAVNAKDRIGFTALHTAAIFNSLDVIPLLIERGAHVNAAGPDGRTPLELAAAGGWADVCRYLIAAGASRTDTLPFAAAEGGDIEALRACTDGKPERWISASDKGGRTLLHAAAGHANAEMCEWLLEHGVDVNARDATGRTPLHHLAADGFQQAEVSMWRRLPMHLMVATIKAHDMVTRTFRVLQQAGATTEKDQHGRTPLHLAAETGEHLTIMELMSGGVLDFNAPDQDGNTPLHLATMRGADNEESMGVVKTLLAVGANVNAQNEAGRTPLHTAVADEDGPSMDMLNTLLSHGADPDAKDREGHTPADLARSNSTARLTGVLLSKALEQHRGRGR